MFDRFGALSALRSKRPSAPLSQMGAGTVEYILLLGVLAVLAYLVLSELATAITESVRSSIMFAR